MADPGDFLRIKEFLLVMTYSQARILAMLVPVPIFTRGVVPVTMRTGIAMGLGLMVAPTLMGPVMAQGFDLWHFAFIMVKEIFVGLVLGCLIAVPFWAFEAVGFLVDNQRGASIAATLNPLTGNDSSPLGILFNQAFIVFFFVSGGFLIMLDILYDSFTMWPVLSGYPRLQAQSIPILIDQVMRLLKIALLLSAPGVVAMFLSELGLALVSLFVPQLQVFFLAMPIKSAVVILVLMLYMSTLFDYAGGQVGQLRELLETLQSQWGSAR